MPFYEFQCPEGTVTGGPKRFYRPALSNWWGADGMLMDILQRKRAPKKRPPKVLKRKRRPKKSDSGFV
jgi:hypothetical protein